MTAVEVYQDRTPAIVDYRNTAVQSLAEWAASAQAAHEVAAALVRTSFVPAQFRGKPDEATAAILAGLECGLQPMAALRSFDIIQGQAAPRALTLRAIAQSFGHEIVVEESTATRCKVKGRRRDSSEWQTVTWTLDRARGLSLLGKDNWKKQPQAMLQARATAEMARLIAADAILGIGYSSEEIADGAGAGVEVPADTVPSSEPVAAAGTRKMSRRTTKPADTPEPPAEPKATDDDVVDGEVVEDAPPASGPPISEKQHRMLMALLNGAGITEHDDRVSYLSDVLGVQVDSSRSLDVDQASRVIDELKAKA